MPGGAKSVHNACESRLATIDPQNSHEIIRYESRPAALDREMRDEMQWHLDRRPEFLADVTNPFFRRTWGKSVAQLELAQSASATTTRFLRTSGPNVPRSIGMPSSSYPKPVSVLTVSFD